MCAGAPGHPTVVLLLVVCRCACVCASSRGAHETAERERGRLRGRGVFLGRGGDCCVQKVLLHSGGKAV